MRKTRFFQDLQRSITLSAAMGILLTGFIVAVIGIYPLFERIKVMEEQSLVSAANSRAMTIGNYLSGLGAVAAQIASRTRAREILDAYNDERLTHAEFSTALEPILDDALANSDQVVGITRLDRRGRFALGVGVDLPEEMWSYGRGESLEVNGPFTIAGEELLLVSVPIVDRLARRLGTDLVLFRTHDLYAMLKGAKGVGQTGSMRIVIEEEGWRERYIVASEKTGRVEVLPLTIDPLSAQAALKRIRGVSRTEVNGQEAVIARVPIQQAPWSLVVRMDPRELYGQVMDQVMWIGIAITALILLGTLATYFRLRPLSGRVLVQAGKLAAEVEQRKTVQHELREARDRAEAASRAKSEFLAVMSHEIRTPLNAIIGMGELIEESELNQEQRRYLSIMRNAGDTLLDLISDVLDLAKLEAGQLELERSPFDLAQLVASTNEVLSAGAGRKQIRLHYQIDPVVPRYVAGDARWVRQILVNLIGNAVKFTDEGGVTTTVSWIRDIDGVDKVMVSVADTGIGIPEHQLDRIFQSFTQVDSSHSRRHAGTGLGLAITRQLVERMGGRIWAKSDSGRGSVFTFTIVLDEAEPPERPQIEAPGTEGEAEFSGSREMCILLAEDSEDNVTLVRSLLKSTPYRIEVARNGEEALAAFTGGAFDLVLMDIQMPVMDGYTATRKIREWESSNGGGRVPIYALTAYAMSGDADKSLQAGCDGHLTKPIRKATLLESIAEVRRNGRQAA